MLIDLTPRREWRLVIGVAVTDGNTRERALTLCAAVFGLCPAEAPPEAHAIVERYLLETGLNAKPAADDPADVRRRDPTAFVPQQHLDAAVSTTGRFARLYLLCAGRPSPAEEAAFADRLAACCEGLRCSIVECRLECVTSEPFGRLLDPTTSLMTLNAHHTSL